MDSTDSDDTEVADGFSAANNVEDFDDNENKKKERSSAGDGRGENPESEAPFSKQVRLVAIPTTCCYKHTSIAESVFDQRSHPALNTGKFKSQR